MDYNSLDYNKHATYNYKSLTYFEDANNELEPVLLKKIK